MENAVSKKSRGLSAKDCYSGQRVFRVMWADEQQLARRKSEDWSSAWFTYRAGRVPEMWSWIVEKAHANGTIVVAGHGKIEANVYCCELDAVNAGYEWFCVGHLTPGAWNLNSFCSMSEGARVLRLLSEMEDGIHNQVAYRRQKRDVSMR